MESEKVANSRRALRWGLTCDKGRCEEKIIKKGKEITEICKFKPKIGEPEENQSEGESCLYYLQKYKALNSNHSLWNYYSYFQIMKYNHKLFSKYLDRKVSIFDEAHKIEDQIIQFIGIDLFKSQIAECEIDIKNFDLDDIDSMANLLEDMSEFYSRKIKNIKETKEFQMNPDYEIITKLERRYERVTNARIEILENKENFVVNDVQKDVYGDFSSVSIKPVGISKFVKEFFGSEYKVFMSATINKSSFCENTGMDPESVAFVDFPKSPFSLDNRRIDFLNVKRLSYGSTEEDELEVIKKIDEIMSEYSNQRGLILTSSVPRCYKILKNLSEKNKQRIRICHSFNRNGKTQDQILKEHEEDPNGVLLSSSLWEGVDLKNELSRFQIIAKVPYPNYKEKRTSEKMKRFPLWYTSQTLTKLLQGFGRSVRNEEDWATSFVLDAAVNNVLFKGRELIPKSFHDVLGLERSRD